MNDHRGLEARGYAGQCLLHHPLSAFLSCQLSYAILTPADQKVWFPGGLHSLVIWDTTGWNVFVI